MHYLMDMGEAGGWYNLAGGASEQRFGPGYGEGIESWIRGEVFPLGDPGPQRPQRGRDAEREEREE
jgi:hypothetical protein